ncbi:MAG: MFS transporter [Chloroflexi bacterium]|nr:MFS transporter [Chloroflexota bacterium]
MNLLRVTRIKELTPGSKSSVARTRIRWLPSTFNSLQHRNYRLLWLGTLISSSGDWMDQIAFSWLVYQQTGSAIYLAVVNLCRMAPIMVFTLIGGVVADRVERRRLMFTTQTVAMLLALLLAVLVSTGLIQLWMILLIAVGRGVMMSFNQPARQSLISELVPQNDLANAIALNSATLNLTRIIGPAIGGVLIASVGVAGAFYLNAASFLAVLYGLALMRFPELTRAAHRDGVLTDLVSGVRYLYGQPALRTLVLLALVPLVFGMPYNTMLAVFAKDVLKIGGGGLGLLTACSGIGALAGSLSVASFPITSHRGRLMLAGLVGFGLSLIVFATSHWLWLSLLALMAIGVSQQVYMTTNNTLIQTYVDKEYRGRILSTLFLNRGMVPLGTMIAGFGTATFGAPVTITGMAAVLVLMALAATIIAPAARKIQ